MFKNNIKYLSVALLASTLSFASALAFANPVTGKPKERENDLGKLDELHYAFSSLLHKQLLSNNIFKSSGAKNIRQLDGIVKTDIANNKPVEAANIIIRHIPMLKNNYDNLVIFDFINILLQQNELKSANLLFNILKSEGDKTLYSNAAFYFAKYHYQHGNWGKVLEFLDDTITDLPPSAYHYALLVKGISLQKRLKHREAIETYRKIPPESHVYIPARLNMATANIRQGWWTDAHNIINAVLSRKTPTKNVESTNRLYLTLGYSFLYKEYYRNSREAFRNVGLKSRYTNRALLGLALTAANQEDYIGALNAIRILKDRTSRDLVTDEAYFLMPYFYEKLQQHTTASAGYSEAISYYDNRISRIQKILHANNEIYKYALLIDKKGVVRFDKMELDLSRKFPEYVFRNYLNLSSYTSPLEQLGDSNLNKKYDELQNQYALVIRKMITEFLEERIKQLNSYKDQSRYGLARLYDNELATNK